MEAILAFNYSFDLPQGAHRRGLLSKISVVNQTNNPVCFFFFHYTYAEVKVITYKQIWCK